MPRIVSDIDVNQTKRIFEVLRDETTLFEGMTQQEVNLVSGLFKILTFSK